MTESSFIRDLVDKNDPRLRTTLVTFNFENPPRDPVELSRELAETMIYNNGLGIAANQIGEMYRVFAIKAEEIMVCFNPRILDTSTETVMMEEGCLSFPLMYVKIRRPKKIRVRYTEPSGETVTKVFDGMTARIFQHELDHLDGIVYTSRANRFHIEKAIKTSKNVKKLTRGKKLSPEAKDLMDWLKV
jgi:peptide deformylase